MKKKLIKNLVKYLLPFLLIFALFTAFDPYDYWLLNGSPTYVSRSVSGMRELLLTQPENILLGDSRMANFNADYIKQISGEDWCILAYGGATLNENIKQFWYAAEHTTLKKVVFGVNFYNLNDNHYSEGRVDDAIETAENPLKFYGNFNIWLEMISNLRAKTQNKLADLTGNEDLRIFVDDPSSLTQDIQPPQEYDEETGYRENLKEYAEMINGYLSGYHGALNYLDRFEEIIDYCDANGIEITFLIPNSNRTMWEMTVFQLEIDDYIEIYKNRLKSRAIVYDMEFYNDYALDDSLYYDCFHFMCSEKQHLMRVFFADEECEYCIRTTPEEYLEMKENGTLPPLDWTDRTSSDGTEAE